MLNHRILLNDADLPQYRPAWNRILDMQDDISPFLTYEWLSAAWQWNKVEKEPMMIVILRGDEPVGFIPLSRTKCRKNHLVHVKLEYMSCPDSQENRPLVFPDYQDEVTDILCRILIEKKNKWDIFEIGKITPSSPFSISLGQAMAGRGCIVEHEDSISIPVLPLEGTWAEYYTGRSRRLRKGNSHVENRLKKSFSCIDIRCVRSDRDAPEDVHSAVQEYIKISSSSWKKSTGLTLDQPGPMAFIKALSNELPRETILSIWFLYLDGFAVAGEYQLICSGHVYALRADYLESYARYSPGTYLNWKILEAIYDDPALHFYEMGPGKNKYKMRWTDRVQHLQTLTVYSPSLRGRALTYIDRHIAPFMKGLYERMK